MLEIQTQQDKARMRERVSRFAAMFLLLAGALMIASGAALLGTDNISCDRSSMTPDDVCRVVEDGTVVAERSFDEMKSEYRMEGYGRLGVGVLIIGVGAWSVRSARRASKPGEPRQAGKAGKPRRA